MLRYINIYFRVPLDISITLWPTAFMKPRLEEDLLPTCAELLPKLVMSQGKKHKFYSPD